MTEPLPPWLIWLDTCDSTNAWAYRHADTLYHGQVIYTRNQTHGRGQYGRRWHSGGFTASFVLASSPRISAPSLGAALAVVQAVESKVPSLRNQLQLKWPNDVMAQGKKLAGILCEQHQQWLVVGVGLNLRLNRSNNELPQATSLHTLIPATDPLPTELDLLVAIREELLWCWEGSRDWLRAVNQRDFLRGRTICVTGHAGTHPLWHGKGAGINAKGHLQLRLASGEVVTVASGHVIYDTSCNRVH